MRTVPFCVSLLVAACGSDPESPRRDAGTDAGPGIAPEWTDPPAAPIAIGQGQTRVLPFTVTDADGDDVTATAAPPAGLEVEIKGTEIEVHADYSITGAVGFDVTLDDGRAAPVVVSVAVEVSPIRWVGGEAWLEADGPEAREHGAIVVDPEGGRALLVDGSGYAPYLEPLDDVWSYDLASGDWTLRTPTGDVPSGGGSRRVAQVPGARVAYLFGGYGVDGASNADLYRVTFDRDEPDFMRLAQENAPPPRALHAFAYDAETDRFFLFGGASTRPANDTWVMTLDGDTATWTEVETPVAPSPRYGFFYGVDEANGRLVLFSGAQGFSPIDPAPDTWALDLRADPPAWSLVVAGDAPDAPAGRRNGCAIFDPSGPRLFVFGGTADAATTEEGLFALDARPGHEGWTRLDLADAPEVRSSGFGLHDGDIDETLFGFGNTSSDVFRDWNRLGY